MAGEVTEALEARLTAIFDGLDNDIVTVSDAIFLREFIKAQAKVVEELREQLDGGVTSPLDKSD